MKKLSTIALVLAVVALGLSVQQRAHEPEKISQNETAYERVMRTQTLRCGYGSWKPGIYKDPNTGKMEGLFVELIETMGRLSNLTIEWADEVDWGQIAESINSGKIDAFCAGMANDAMRGKRLAYTTPLSYWTFDVIVRADDTRFPTDTASVGDLNKQEYSTAYSEGDVLETIAKGEFPLVKSVPLPPLGTPADNVMNVLTKKTDFVIMPKVIFHAFNAANPDKLRFLKISPPLRSYGNVIAVGMDDLRLQQVLNASITELVNSSGYVQILAKYNQNYPGSFLPVRNSYEAKE